MSGRPEKVDLADKLSLFDEVFQPKIVARYNDNKVQVAKVEGEFVWHSHPDTDDFFLVLAGQFVSWHSLDLLGGKRGWHLLDQSCKPAGECTYLFK